MQENVNGQSILYCIVGASGWGKWIELYVGYLNIIIKKKKKKGVSSKTQSCKGTGWESAAPEGTLEKCGRRLGSWPSGGWESTVGRFGTDEPLYRREAGWEDKVGMRNPGRSGWPQISQMAAQVSLETEMTQGPRRLLAWCQRKDDGCCKIYRGFLWPVVGMTASWCLGHPKSKDTDE